LKSNILIRLDFFSGDTLYEYVKEAKVKAIQHELSYISFIYRGVRFSISNKCNCDKVVRQFKELNKKIGNGEFKSIVW